MEARRIQFMRGVVDRLQLIMRVSGLRFTSTHCCYALRYATLTGSAP